MNKFKKAFTAFISILLVLSMIVPVSALEGFDGTGGNGTSGTTGSDWNIPNGNVERSAIVGYRFSIVTSDGDLRGHSINIYTSDYNRGNAHNGGAKIRRDDSGYTQVNRIYYHDHYTDVHFSDDGSFKWSNTNSTDTFLDSSLGLGANGTLTCETDILNTRLNQPEFRTAIGDKCGVLNLHTSYLILVEPLYIAKLGGTNYVMTTPEWAIYMMRTWTGGWDTTMSNSHTQDAASFYNIDTYVCAAMPAWLYVSGWSKNYDAYNATTKTYFNGKIKVPGSYIRESFSRSHSQFSGTAFIGPNAAAHGGTAPLTPRAPAISPPHSKNDGRVKGGMGE